MNIVPIRFNSRSFWLVFGLVRVCDRAHKNYAQLTLQRQIYRKMTALLLKKPIIYQAIYKKYQTKSIKTDFVAVLLRVLPKVLTNTKSPKIAQNRFMLKLVFFYNKKYFRKCKYAVNLKVLAVKAIRSPHQLTLPKIF